MTHPSGAGEVAGVIRWTDAMSVGVGRLDQDHRVLIDLINRLADGGAAERDAAAIAEVLAALVAYTRFHFRREERVMAACGYTDLDHHRDEHRLLADEVDHLQARFVADPAAVPPAELLLFLTDWLNHHILLQDMAYRDAIADLAEAERVALGFGEFDPDGLAQRPAAAELPAHR
jgi:hemerythrin-like metal-binding protein